MFKKDGKHVYFQYTAEPVKNLKSEVQFPEKLASQGETVLRVTRCYIKDENDAITIAEGLAGCSPSDTFEKKKGRKVALKDALDRFSQNILGTFENVSS